MHPYDADTEVQWEGATVDANTSDKSVGQGRTMGGWISGHLLGKGK